MNILVFCFMILMLLSVVTTGRMALFRSKQISQVTVMQHALYSKRANQENGVAKTSYYGFFDGDNGSKGLSSAVGINFFRYWPSRLNLDNFKKDSVDDSQVDLLNRLAVKLLPKEYERQVSDLVGNLIEELKKSTKSEDSDFARQFSTLNHLANIDFKDVDKQKEIFYLLNAPEWINRSSLANFDGIEKSLSLHDVAVINSSQGDKIRLSLAPEELVLSIFENSGGKNLWPEMLRVEEEVSSRLRNVDKGSLTEEEKRNYLTKAQSANAAGVSEADLPKYLTFGNQALTDLKISGNGKSSKKPEKPPSSKGEEIPQSPPGPGVSQK